MSRTKRITDPLGEKLKALVVSGDSSGSEHGGDDSPSLSDLVEGFLFGCQWPENESDTESEPDPSEDSAFPAIVMRTDTFRNALLAHVYKAMEMFSCLKSDKSAMRRSVMGYLRGTGLDAAICKTRWESSGGITAGSHEFIDVIVKNNRYIIEIHFASEFEIARPTSHYARVLNTLPAVFIGSKEELKHIVKAMSDSARNSLKSRGLTLPPWRKNRFMQNKWFGSYRRTINSIPSSFPSFRSPATGGFGVKCRFVGFDAVNGGLMLPATTRTR